MSMNVNVGAYITEKLHNGAVLKGAETYITYKPHSGVSLNDVKGYAILKSEVDNTIPAGVGIRVPGVAVIGYPHSGVNIHSVQAYILCRPYNGESFTMVKDTVRRIPTQSGDIKADLVRRIMCSDEVSADLERAEKRSISLFADTQAVDEHHIRFKEFSFLVDTDVKNILPHDILTDSSREIIAGQDIFADTAAEITCYDVGIGTGFTDLGNEKWVYYNPSDPSLFAECTDYTISQDSTHSYSGRAIKAASFKVPKFPVSEKNQAVLKSKKLELVEVEDIWVAFDFYVPSGVSVSKGLTFYFSGHSRTDEAYSWSETSNTLHYWNKYSSNNMITFWYDQSPYYTPSPAGNTITRVVIHQKTGPNALFEVYLDGKAKIICQEDYEGYHNIVPEIFYVYNEQLENDFYISELYITNDYNTALKLGINSMYSFSHFDLARSLFRTEEIFTDTLRKTKDNYLEQVILDVDTKRKTQNNFVMIPDAERMIKPGVQFNGDISIRLVIVPFVDFVADVQRDVKLKSVSVSDTIRRMPFDTNFYLPNNRDEVSDPFTHPPCKEKNGMVSMTIVLNELSLSDTFELETTQPIDVLDEISGQIIDFKYSYAVSEINYTGLSISASGMYDVDRILYTPMTYSTSTLLRNVSYHAGKIASAFGKRLNFRMRDFKHSSSWVGGGQTYDSIISSLFGWSSSIPHKQINVFMRAADNSLNVIQRGYETSVIDITEWHYTRPKYQREIVRTMWSAKSRSSYSHKAHSVNVMPVPFSGTISFGDATCSYSNGYLISEISNGNITSYSYEGTQDTGVYLSSKTTKHADGSITEVNYNYGFGSGPNILGSEVEITTDVHGSQTVRKTIHAPLGSGFYGTSVYVDDDYQGSSISTGSPAAVASQYLLNQESITMGGANYGDVKNNNSSYNFIDDAGFPVEDDGYLKELTNELKWLNRRIKETVSMDVYLADHVVDFTERVRFRGSEYYLQSNTISQTTRELKQSITLVRWY